MASNTDMNQQTKTGGSAWLGSGALLALGGALPGLLLAWKWEQVAASDIITVVAAAAAPKRCCAERAAAAL